MSIRFRDRHTVLQSSPGGGVVNGDPYAWVDRHRMLPIGDALAALIAKDGHGPLRKDLNCWCGAVPCRKRDALVDWRDVTDG